MKNNQYILMPIAWICFCMSALSRPTLAAEPTNANTDVPMHTNEITLKSDKVGQSNISPPRLRKSTIPKKICSVATAIFLGTPICIVRRSKYEEWYGVHGMIGDSGSKCKKVLAGTFWLPFAVITGTLEAPFDATANSLMYPALSKDQLSQGKLIQNN